MLILKGALLGILFFAVVVGHLLLRDSSASGIASKGFGTYAGNSARTHRSCRILC
jgi:hypothetical protein